MRIDQRKQGMDGGDADGDSNLTESQKIQMAKEGRKFRFMSYRAMRDGISPTARFFSSSTCPTVSGMSELAELAAKDPKCFVALRRIVERLAMLEPVTRAIVFGSWFKPKSPGWWRDNIKACSYYRKRIKGVHQYLAAKRFDEKSNFGPRNHRKTRNPSGGKGSIDGRTG